MRKLIIYIKESEAVVSSDSDPITDIELKTIMGTLNDWLKLRLSIEKSIMKRKKVRGGR